MYHQSNNVIKVTDSQVQYLAQRSKELDQETRISVYTFNEHIECVIYDKDVLRMPSIAGFYSPTGCTNLVGATIKALKEAKEISQRYGDHSFLFYIITDGANNIENHNAQKLQELINNCPDNFTVACLVPDQTGVHEAKRFGFPVENIQVWDVNSAKGYAEVGEKITKSTENFFQARAQGFRGTRNLFNLDLKNLNVKQVATELDQVYPYTIHKTSVTTEIRPLTEQLTGTTYVKGQSYYELTKKEEIQNYKQILVQNKKTGKVYGGANARTLLGFPDTTVNVKPSDHPEWTIFVQSTSVNRKLLAGNKMVVMVA